MKNCLRQFWLCLCLKHQISAIAPKLAKELSEVRVSDVIGVVLKACEVIARTFKDGENRQDIRKGREFALWLSYTAYELTQRGVDPVLMQDLHKVEGAD
jgi:hypothetical protein